jgi:hypothetical protein
MRVVTLSARRDQRVAGELRDHDVGTPAGKVRPSDLLVHEASNDYPVAE